MLSTKAVDKIGVQATDPMPRLIVGIAIQVESVHRRKRDHIAPITRIRRGRDLKPSLGPTEADTIGVNETHQAYELFLGTDRQRGTALTHLCAQVGRWHLAEEDWNEGATVNDRLQRYRHRLENTARSARSVFPAHTRKNSASSINNTNDMNTSVARINPHDDPVRAASDRHRPDYPGRRADAADVRGGVRAIRRHWPRRGRPGDRLRSSSRPRRVRALRHHPEDPSPQILITNVSPGSRECCAHAALCRSRLRGWRLNLRGENFSCGLSACEG
jgi:hypothetical protein